MNIPKLDIPEAEKNKSWIKSVATAIVGISKSNAFNKKADTICWNMYNKELNGHEFEYLYKEGDSVLPARVRMLGYQRSYCNVLISQQARRPFPFSVASVDEASIREKHEKKVKQLVEMSIAEMKAAYYETLKARKRLEAEKQKMLEILSIQPENEEQAMMQEQVKEMLPEIETTFQMIEDQMTRAGKLQKEQLDKIEFMSRYDAKDSAEEIAISLLKKAETEDKVKKASTDAFRRQVVTGKHFYYVDIAPGRKTPVFQVLDERKCYYPSGIEVEFTHELPWFSINEYISYNDFINKYGHRLSAKEKEQIYASINIAQGQFASIPGNGAIDRSEIDPSGMYAGSHLKNGGISVWRVFFKAPRKIYVKYNKNKYKEGEYFRHIITEKDIEDEARKAEKRDDIFIETRYIDDLYEAIVTEDGTFIEGYKRKDAVRDIDTPSNVFIPVFGRVYGGSEKPYSLVWATRDIEILIAIINFYKELLVATAGVKGQIIDLSHKPSDMSMQEQTYHRKKGSLYIQTVSDSGRRVNPSFNQWREYDDTISASVQYLDAMIDNLDKTMGRIMGINYQRLGERHTGDQVGTYQMAAEQSVLVTEILYDDFDEVLREALTHYIRIMAKYTYKNGGYAHYNHMAEGNRILRIPENLLAEKDFKVIIANTLKNEADLRELKQHAFRYHEKGMLPFHQLVSIHGIQNVKTLEKKLQYFAEEAERLAAENNQASMEQQAMLQEQMLKLQAQLDMEIEKQKNAVKEMAIQIDQARLELDKQIADRNSQIAERKVVGDQSLKAMEIQSENAIESEYLQEMGRSAQVNERLKAIEIQLEAIINSSNIDLSKIKLNLDSKKEDNRHNESMKKITTSTGGGVRQISRNRIKD